MSTGGFFTRQSASAVKKHPTRTKDSVDTARSMGVAAVKRMNPDAITPMMEPWGQKSAEVLVLLDAPRVDDDETGRPLSCPMGRQYKKWLTKRGDFAVDHICRTLPPKGRGPNATEIAAFESVVTENILRQKPKVIIAAGHSVVKWLSPGIKHSIFEHRGRMFPIRVGDHECWMAPIVPPWHADTLFEKGTKTAYGEEYKKITRRDLSGAFALTGEPLQIDNPDDYNGKSGDCIITLKPDVGAFREFMQEEKDCRQTFFDIEATRLRPYFADFRMLSIATTGDKLTLSMPYDHPEAQMPNMRKVLRQIEDCFYEWFEEKVVTAHNLIYDLEVFHHLFGYEIIDFPKRWECTQVAAFCLDQRWGQGLDYLSRLYLGFSLKALNPGDLWLEKYSVRELLQYGAGDSKGGQRIRRLIKDHLNNEGMDKVWEFRCERIPALVQTMAAGFPVNQNVVEELRTEFQRDIDEVEQKLLDLPEIQEFNEKHHPFRPTSPEDVGLLYDDILGHPEVVKGSKGKKPSYKTGKEVLEQFTDVERSASLILEHRRLAKMVSTYLDKYRKDDGETYIFPDGLVHPQFSTTNADGGRLACEKPNAQNFPNRGDGKRTRRIFQ